MIYFDNGATTFPKPQSVYDAITEAMTTYGANPGRSGHSLSLKMDRAIYNTRDILADFIGGDNPLSTIFTYNCTDSLNIAIKGSVNKGDHVITTSMEHNSVLRPLYSLESEGIIQLTVVYGDKMGLINPEDIENAIKPNTSLVVTTMMSNLTGTIVDVEAIGTFLRKKGIRYIVDVAQAIGLMNIDMSKLPVDIICFPGHKGLYGPMGTGGLYLNHTVDVKPFREGGTGSFSQDIHQPDIYPDRLESGTANGPGIVGLGAGIEFVKNIGVEKINRHEMELRNRLINGIKDIDGIIMYGPLDHRQGPVLSINLEGMDSSELAYRLDDEFGICVRPGIHCAPLAHKTIGTQELGVVRFSFSYFNTYDEVDIAIDAIKKIKGGKIDARGI